MKVKRILASVFVIAVLLCYCLRFVSCTDYINQYHFYVKGGNGDLYAVWGEELIDSYNSPVVFGGSGKVGTTMDFIAVPDEGYQVKQWTCNLQIIKENINTYTAIGGKDEHRMIITVEFEPIEEIEGE